MTKEEILSGNKLIAEFMGMVYNPEATGRYGRFWINNKSKGSKKIGAGFKFLKYHSSWDWLMLVVEKLERITFTNVVIINSKCNIRHFITKELDFAYSKTSESSSKIESVWLAVVEFIKWYNQQSK